ncbi:aspartate aminotransferase family protein [Burkholderia multivorans]|uniref:aspartate aminotransferase family protein n=1 Tax=Burkholderia multivorans TaxID=87883 RepID=UPI0012DE6FF0|nr:aspartate aminotransferase family protein [Burkholderia multivorans]MBU9341020.1 aspartate aminotransferase family protein [Burkholderia multivorans]QGR64232.1 aspartate aminotransferase family protein [Burkholderia multivorans]
MNVNPDTDLQALAKRHLLMHFTHADAYGDAALTVFDRGEGCWLVDRDGKRYFDALAGLYCVQVGYSHGAEIGDAVREQMTRLPFATNWSYAHEAAIRLAERLATLAPEGLNRVFFTSSGSESNESAIKLVRQYHQARGEPQRRKFIARRVAYHGTSFGALALNGMTAFRKHFEPLMSGVRHVGNTKRYGRPVDETEAQFTRHLLDEIESLIVQEGPDTVAAIVVEPLQNAGGSLTPPAGYTAGLREICDRHGVLLVADEVICGFGRVGEYFGSTRYGLKPDIITFAKGIASGYVPLGGVIASDAVVDAVLAGPQQMFLHGATYGGHPVACAAALANLAIIERERVFDNVRDNAAYFRATLDALLELPCVGDVRGDGYHYSLELVTDKQARRWTGSIDARTFVSTVLAPAIFDAGLLCRAGVDHEGTPIVQFSPPLVMTRDEIAWFVAQIRDIVADAYARATR